MRARLISALSLLLPGCVAITTASTEEAVLFSNKQVPAENTQAKLQPYNDVPLSLEFVCPDKLATLSTFYVVPVPPVIPAGFVNEPVSYLRVRMPVGAESAIAQTRIVGAGGTALTLSDAQPSKRAASSEGTTELTYALDKDCASLNGGVLEVAGFSYKDKKYPASVARLQVASKTKAGVAWWPPMWFDRPLAARRTSDAPEAAAK